MITDMDAMLEERLLLYKKRNKGLLPERVYIFRDGVSEGQFGVVNEKELPLVQKAFKRVYGTNKPPALSIIICGSECGVPSILQLRC